MALDPSELFPEVPNLYEFPSVHRYMIYDEHRVGAYQRAIQRTVKKGDVVVDVGTGTGLLSFLCLQAGASRVHAIDRAPVIETARELARVNGWAERIVFHHADARDVEIPEKADVMISELIGHMAFEEGMLETLSLVRNRFTKPGAKVIPQNVALKAAPVQESEVYRTQIDGWRPQYGIDFSPLREQAVRACYVTEIDEADLLAVPQTVLSVGFDACGPLGVDVQNDLMFTVHRGGRVNGLAMWFDAALASDVALSSGPWAKTHWDQVFAPIPEPLDVRAGDTIRASVEMVLRTRRSDSFRFHVEMTKGRI